MPMIGCRTSDLMSSQLRGRWSLQDIRFDEFPVEGSLEPSIDSKLSRAVSVDGCIVRS